MRDCKTFIIAAAMLAQWGICAAETLVDPMRPPAELELPQAASAGGVVAGPVLQSVLISPGRKSALISGQMVQLGGSFGDARLIKITESEVVLRSGDTLQTLRLFPDVEKQVIAPDRARRTGKQPGGGGARILPRTK